MHFSHKVKRHRWIDYRAFKRRPKMAANRTNSLPNEEAISSLVGRVYRAMTEEVPCERSRVSEWLWQKAWNFINISSWQQHQFFTRDTMWTFFRWLSFPGKWSFFPFLSTITIASIIYSWIVQGRLLCTKTWNLKISRQLFFNIAGVSSTHSWPFTRHFFSHCSVYTANYGGDGFLVWQRIRPVCRHFRSPFERTIIDPAVTLYFMSEVHES